MNITLEQIAYLGSLVYIGICIATLIASYVFHKLSANWVIGVMVILNGISCNCFILTEDIKLLYGIRIFMGFTQAFVVIHGPVWVNEYSPSESNSRWLAMLHGAVVIGIISGYIMTALIDIFF